MEKRKQYVAHTGGKNDSNRKASGKSISEWFTNSVTSEGHGSFNNKEWIARKKDWAEKIVYVFYSLRKINSLHGYTYRFENQ